MKAVICLGVCVLAMAGTGGCGEPRADAARSGTGSADRRVSPGGEIVFVVQKRGTENLFSVGADGAGLTQLTELPSSSIMSRRPAVSPDGSALAFAASGIVYVLRRNASAATEIARDDAHSPAWSPDGGRLAFLKRNGGTRMRLYLATADASTISELSAGWPSLGSGFASDLVWSPDGQQLAFLWSTLIAGRHRNRNIYVVNADGSGLTAITDYPESTYNPMEGLSWSPDGRRLALSCYEGAWSIATVNADGSEWTTFGRDALMKVQPPAWSPDGSRLAWSTPRALVVSNPQGGELRQLVSGYGDSAQPAFSSDGMRVAFVGDHLRGRLFVVNADGSGLTQLTDLGQSVSYPVWRPPQREETTR